MITSPYPLNNLRIVSNEAELGQWL